MNGADLIVKTAAASGIEYCFANPGTTELPLVAAFEQVTGIKPILGLFEGTCTGAADGYGRMADKPAMTLLHLGPGLANGLANLHNARRGGTPIVNLIGEHATWHLPVDAPLTMDIHSLAATVPGWQRVTANPGTLSQDTADAVTAAMTGKVATLIVPHDHQWATDFDELVIQANMVPVAPDQAILEKAAQILRSADKSAIVLGGRALRSVALEAAAKIRRITGCQLLSETFPGRMDRAPGLPLLTRSAYFPSGGRKMYADYRHVLLAGAREPVSLFGYQNTPSRFLSDEQACFDLAPGDIRPDLALIQLADALSTLAGGSVEADVAVQKFEPPALPNGALTAQAACAALAALQPEGAVIVDESITSGAAYFDYAATAAPHSWLTLTGGSLGMGIPSSVGAALACPDRSVINLQADGSAYYTIQGLWMQASQGLNITTLICANRSYDILKIEMHRAGYKPKGPAAQAMTDLGGPDVDWVQLSQGFGVPAVAVDTADDLVVQMQRALAEPGPHLICMNLKSMF